MEIQTLSTRNVAVQTMICSLVLQTAQKSLLSLLFMIEFLNLCRDLVGAERRFPFGELKRTTAPDNEPKDSSEAENHDDENEDNGDTYNDEEDDENEENEDTDNDEEYDEATDDDDDDEEDSDGDGESDDDSNDEDEDDDDDDEDDEEEENNQPIYKKIK